MELETNLDVQEGGGIQIRFRYSDSAATNQGIGEVGFLRGSGANDSDFFVNCYLNNVSTERLRIDENGNADFSGGDLTVDATKRIFLDGGGNTSIQEIGADDVIIRVGGEIGLRLIENGTEISVFIGVANVLATNAVWGFLYISSMAGNPTGTPTALTGKVAIVYDTTNNELFIYNGSWRSVALA